MYINLYKQVLEQKITIIYKSLYKMLKNTSKLITSSSNIRNSCNMNINSEKKKNNFKLTYFMERRKDKESCL